MTDTAKDLPEATPKLRPVVRPLPDDWGAALHQGRQLAPQTPNPFGQIQEAQRAITSVQERLDELAKRLVGEPPRFVAPESPSVPTSGGLLGVTGLCARNMRARAEHMDQVLNMIEAGLG